MGRWSNLLWIKDYMHYTITIWDRTKHSPYSYENVKVYSHEDGVLSIYDNLGTKDNYMKTTIIPFYSIEKIEILRHD
jgi:hypothetical protein